MRTDGLNVTSEAAALGLRLDRKALQASNFASLEVQSLFPWSQPLIFWKDTTHHRAVAASAAPAHSKTELRVSTPHPTH